MIAISTDDLETQRRFKASLQAPFHFVADEKGEVVRAFGVKMAVLNVASRTTLVVGKGLTVLSKQEGSDALDPSGAVKACSLRPPESLQFITPDGGAKR